MCGGYQIVLEGFRIHGVLASYKEGTRGFITALLPLAPAQPPHPACLQPPPAAATLPNPHPAPLPPPLPGTIEFPEFLRMFKDELLDLNEVRTLTLMAALLGCRQRWFQDWDPGAY